MNPDQRVPATAGIRVTVDDAAWRSLVRRPEAVAARAAAVASEAAGVGISIVLTDDRTIRRLNARHRGRDRPTNVLTFEPPVTGLPGEMLLGRQTVQREASAAGLAMRDHLAHLVVHGALHLAGHDHQSAGEARRMEMAEARLLARVGVGNPWRPRRCPRPKAGRLRAGPLELSR